MTEALQKTERIFAVDTAGNVSIAVANKPAKLTYGQRHAGWRIGIIAFRKFLDQKGFRSETDYMGAVLCYTKKNLTLTVSIKAPDRIAHVTSYEGYEPGKKGKVIGRDIYGQEVHDTTAKVTSLGSILGDVQDVLMIEVTDAIKGSAKPVYVGLDREHAEPAKFVFKSILDTLQILGDKNDALRTEFEGVVKDQNLVADLVSDASKQLEIA